MRLRTEGMDWRGILSPGLGLGLCPVLGKDRTGAGRGGGGAHLTAAAFALRQLGVREGAEDGEERGESPNWLSGHWLSVPQPVPSTAA